MFHTLSVRSVDPEIARSPSGVTATAVTAPVWPWSECIVCPLSRSHTRSVPSSDAETARRRDGRYRYGMNEVRMAFKVRISTLPGGVRLGFKGRSQGQTFLSAACFSKA